MKSIIPINGEKHQDFFEKIKKNLCEVVFKEVKTLTAYVWFEFPAISKEWGSTTFMVFIHIPKEEGNYYRQNEKYVSTLALGVKGYRIHDILEVTETKYKTEDGEFQYKDSLRETSKNIGKSIGMYCPIFDWIITDNCPQKIQNDYVILNTSINWEALVKSAITRIDEMQNYKYRLINSFWLKEGVNFEQYTKELINKVTQETKVGILTKRKIEFITSRKAIKRTEEIHSAIGNNLILIEGKAGAGKTAVLLNTMYEVIKNGHRVRLVTFNKLLTLDIIQQIRTLPNVSRNLLSICTLHSFFHELVTRLKVGVLFTDKRKRELQEKNLLRVARVNDVIRDYYVKFHEIDRKGIEDVVCNYDHRNVTANLQYIDYLFDTKKPLSIEELDVLSHQYVEDLIKNMHIEEDVFIKDYYAILRKTYEIVTNTKDAYRNLTEEQRRVYIKGIASSDVDAHIKDEEETVSIFVAKGVKSFLKKVKWSKTIMVDEGQDCNVYEKLLLMHLMGTNKIIVASGGADQLIRRPNPADWSKSSNKNINITRIKLGRKSNRQAGNVISFVNNLARKCGYPADIEISDKLNGHGRVIIEISTKRHSIDIEAMTGLIKQGQIYGCSPQESLMVLLPGNGYTANEDKQTNTCVDDNDNLIKTYDFKRNLAIENLPDCVKPWDATISQKNDLECPNQDEIRFLFYESCRGLEAWSVMCLDLDRFYNAKVNSEGALEYAYNSTELFANIDELKKKYATMWCVMALTRAMHTLYIKLSDKENEFSKMVIECAKQLPFVEWII